jgi:FixJ family two-component response regulator
MKKPMNNNTQNKVAEPVVHIVDDDEAVRDSLSMLLDSVGIKNTSYVSAQVFLDSYQATQLTLMTGCIVLDMRMPGMSGMECQQRLAELKCLLPIIFITGHGDIPMAVETMKRGALEFIQKPFREQQLLDCIQAALEISKSNHSESLYSNEISARLLSLTEREKQVMQGVISGQANKVIAAEMNISQRTVEIHRANVMEKMQAKTLAELVKLVLTQD